jgi:predicted methyltransferase
MKNKFLYQVLILIVLPFSGSVSAQTIDELLDKAIAGDHRDPAFVVRDKYRHPKETLKFFGLQPDMTVVEITPARGWYTEILAPVLRDKGIFYAAGFAMTASQTPDWQKQMQIEFVNKLGARPDVYDHVVVTELSVPERMVIAPPGTADMVLTFRNVHNWMKAETVQTMFEIFYRTLKSGGVLGIVEHRAAPKTPVDKMIQSGYVTEEFVIQLAKAVGFVFEEASEINANPADTKDHPEGVWTLPPNLRHCSKMDNGSSKDACIRKYTAIGESDRMTLRFRKP